MFWKCPTPNWLTELCQLDRKEIEKVGTVKTTAFIVMYITIQKVNEHSITFPLKEVRSELINIPTDPLHQAASAPRRGRVNKHHWLINPVFQVFIYLPIIIITEIFIGRNLTTSKSKHYSLSDATDSSCI